MSQMAPEPAPPPGGSPLTRKVGPLPAWGWIALAIAGGVGFIWWRNRQAASSAAADNTAADTATSEDSANDDAASIATLQSEIQQLQGEASTPAVTANSPTPATGKTRTTTVNKAQTLAQFARARGWPARRLTAAESLNGLSASSRLRKGQVLKLPA
jgi:cytoskeletal protein RodZ